MIMTITLEKGLGNVLPHLPYQHTTKGDPQIKSFMNITQDNG